MRRPDRSDIEVQRRAADKLLPEVMKYLKQNGDTSTEDEIREDLIEAWGWDGYQMCKNLETQCCWDCDSELVEIMDGAGTMEREALFEVELQWVQTFGIKPTRAKGDTVTFPWRAKDMKESEHQGTVDRIEPNGYYVIYPLVEIGPRLPGQVGQTGYFVKWEDAR